MKGIQITSTGGPEVLEYRTAPPTHSRNMAKSSFRSHSQ
jgi:hypothetical protein